MATVGTDTICGMAPASTVTFTYCPGHSFRSALGTVARAVMVPDAVSTVEFTKSSVPEPIGFASPSLVSVTVIEPGFASACCKRLRSASGRLKETRNGSIR